MSVTGAPETPHRPQGALPVVFHPGYVASLPAGHRFPMDKFARVARLVQAEGLVAGAFHTPEPASRALLLAAHTPDYVDGVLGGTLDRAAVRRIGFELTADVVMRGRLATAGTVLAARLALEHGMACNTAGGSHHARAEAGAGFCVFNDVAVAARQLLDEGAARRVLVVDCDVHHGDGTALILVPDPRAFTLSLHCEDNWPLDKPPSDLDVPLPPGLGDAAYLATLDQALDRALAAGPFDLAFYIAGVDVAAGDRLGKLALSRDGIARRDRLVLTRLRQSGVAVCGVLGGGYRNDIDELADLHAQLFRAAAGLMPTVAADA